jgi:predicted Ser/Thr protein kinase
LDEAGNNEHDVEEDDDEEEDDDDDEGVSGITQRFTRFGVSSRSAFSCSS